eukprot:TRINITY_DN2953_c0_g1_i2.p1 TRINITY_DN2953_c0_g1~~TRINITY_DN2953_c0_g1_i2.p1  ORF type:complete len:481 (-),score=93.56 TRINITY_DN2953_c0_g1_i2:26-1468(-)
MEDMNSQNQLGGTTPNVIINRTHAEWGVIYVLDAEGSSASSIPSFLLKILEKIPTESHEKRKKAIDTLVPFFAALVSDLIVYIDNSTFDREIFYKRTKNLLQGISYADKLKPHLFLISNKAESSSLKTSEEMTQSYLQVEDHSTLEDIFESVTCFTLPRWNAGTVPVIIDQVLYFVSDENDSYIIHALEIQDKLKSIIQARNHEKESGDFTFSESTWLDLLKLELESNLIRFKKFKKIRKKHIYDLYAYEMSNLLSEYEISVICDVLSKTLVLIRNHVKSNEELRDNFVIWRQFLMEYSVSIITIKAKSKFIDFDLHSKEALEQYLHDFKTIVQKMNESMFCTKILDGKVCNKHRSNHGSTHSFVKDQNFLVSFFTGSEIIVEGEFEHSSDFKLDIEELGRDFSLFLKTALSNFEAVHMREYIVRRIMEIVDKCGLNHVGELPHLKSDRGDELCWICYGELDNFHKLFCEDCYLIVSILS